MDNTRKKEVCKVSMMISKEKNRYFARKMQGVYDLVKLQYKESKLALVLVIDNHSNKGKKKKGIITKKDIMKCDWKYNKLNLFMPKFKFKYEIELSKILQEMGIKRAFDNPLRSADLSGIIGKPDLYIDKVIHKAIIEVNESGTKAAAVTAVRMKKRCIAPKEDKVATIKFDHPFDFHIIDDDKKAILFSGRFVGK